MHLPKLRPNLTFLKKRAGLPKGTASAGLNDPPLLVDCAIQLPSLTYQSSGAAAPSSTDRASPDQGILRALTPQLLFLYRHTLFYCISHYCSSQIMCFLEMEGLWPPWVNQVNWHHFFNSLRSLLGSVSHLVILTIISNFLLLLYLIWLSMISDYDMLNFLLN